VAPSVGTRTTVISPSALRSRAPICTTAPLGEPPGVGCGRTSLGGASVHPGATVDPDTGEPGELPPVTEAALGML